MPDWPSGSSAEPLRYQTMWVTTGTRRSGMTTTSRPLSRVKEETSGPLPSVRPKGAASVRGLVATFLSDISSHLAEGGESTTLAGRMREPIINKRIELYAEQAVRGPCS